MPVWKHAAQFTATHAWCGEIIRDCGDSCACTCEADQQLGRICRSTPRRGAFPPQIAAHQYPVERLAIAFEQAQCIVLEKFVWRSRMTLIAEVQAANVLVLGVPMYNFGISSQLKNWIDAVARNGVTFRYTEKGPEGLLTGKRAFVGLARGGCYRGTDTDSQVPYLKTVLGFLGITDVHFVYAEGLNMGEEAVRKGFAQAEADIAAAFA